MTNPSREEVVAGALFDFVGDLTTGIPITMGQSVNPTPAIERLKNWAHMRNISLASAAVLDWEKNLDE